LRAPVLFRGEAIPRLAEEKTLREIASSLRSSQ